MKVAIDTPPRYLSGPTTTFKTMTMEFSYVKLTCDVTQGANLKAEHPLPCFSRPGPLAIFLTPNSH